MRISKHYVTRAEWENSSVERALMRDEDAPPLCGHPDCDADEAYAGLCAAHYLADRIAEFHTLYTPVPWSGCWLWEGAGDEYGRFSILGKQVAAHRLSFALAHNRPITDEMHICHICDVPACVNPAHLFEGTHRENMVDSMRKNRRARTLTREKVEMLYRLNEQGIWSLKDMARLSGINAGSASAILSGKKWDLGVKANAA